MIPLELHAHIHGHDVAFDEDPLSRRDSVDDLVVDRRADARRKTVESLERRHGAGMTPDEVVRDLVQLLRGDPWSNRPLHQRHGLGENLAAARHYLDLALRLELNHDWIAFIARRVIASRSPVASISTTSRS